MTLCRLIYASRAVDALRAEDVEQILKVSVERNSKVGITGLLVFGAREFLQCLEGARDVVNATYARIMRDARHSEVTILDYREIGQRLFPDWSMRQTPPVALSRRRLLKYFPRELFAPLRMSGEGAAALLHDLAHGDEDALTQPVAAQRPAFTVGR